MCWLLVYYFKRSIWTFWQMMKGKWGAAEQRGRRDESLTAWACPHCHGDDDPDTVPELEGAEEGGAGESSVARLVNKLRVFLTT